MPAPFVVVPALEAMRRELDAVAPYRDRRSDGGIGDQAHASGRSGHNPDETGNAEYQDTDKINEVRARDFDADLNQPGLTMEMVVRHLVAECHAGRIRWIAYLIYNRRIWSAVSGWSQRVYHGKSPHTEHLHVSCKGDTASENDTRPLGLATLLEDDMAMTQGEFNKLMTGWAASAEGRQAIGFAAWAYKLDDPTSTAKPAEQKTAAAYVRYNDLQHGRTRAAVAALAARNLSGLDPQDIAAAIPANLAEQVADVLAARLKA